MQPKIYTVVNLKKKFSWLNIYEGNNSYIDPKYYNKILKEYIFDNKTDLDILEIYLKNIKNNLPSKISALELGVGSARSTKVLLRNFQSNLIKLDLVDQSQKMINFSKKILSKYSFVRFINRDFVTFMSKCQNKYDLVISLWSLSHSIHYNLHKYSLNFDSKKIILIIKKFIKRNLNRNGKLFIVHFDSLSDEQKILIKQWKKKYKIYNNTRAQSPSKHILDKALKDLAKKKNIRYTIKHHRGKPIEYTNIEEALEIFCNFHLETQFNNSELITEIIQELINYFQRFTKKEKIFIIPGCFIYEIERR